MATYKKYNPGGSVITLTQEQYDAEAAARKAALLAAQAGTLPTLRVSKDKLTRALAAAGKYEAFVAVRASIPAYAQELWSLEPSFITSDPLIHQFLPAVKAGLNLTDAELQAFLVASAY